MKKYEYDSAEFSLLEKSQVPFAIYQFLNKRVVTLVLSQGFLDMFGYDDRADTYELMDNDMYRETHPDDVADIADAAYRFAVDEAPYDVVYRSKKYGEYRIVHAHGRHIFKENGVRLAFVTYADLGPYIENDEPLEGGVSSIISSILRERNLNRRVSYDYLTGLPSMSYFFELGDEGCREMRKNGRIPVILFLDFNGMKSYNYKYGMAEGDRFLTCFTKVLLSHFPNENCSRFSADHFCVFTDSQDALRIANEIIDQSRSLNEGRTMPLRVGVYYYDNDNTSITAACDMAKIACDSSKNDYESRIYVFNQSMTVQIEKRQYIIENFGRALEEGWIKVYHQPIIRTANGRVCNEEALARWIDPEKGMVSPADFIPYLEETNSIYKLDLYMVDQVLLKLKGQMDHGIYVVPESVNFSRADFYACDIVEEVRKRVDASGLSRDKLVIEITESVIADDVEFIKGRVERFKELGFTVWMDDYGSGYSSPSILQKIPFDLLKIDMLFVRQIEQSKSTRIILTELVKMAMALGMETIAEGVETKEQMEFLKEIGCTKLQGYYFSKPISIEEIQEIRRKGAFTTFENPEETDYYVQLGKVSMYDLSVAGSEDNGLDDYFDVWPMVMLECHEDRILVVRCNETFRLFFERNFPKSAGISEFMLDDLKGQSGVYTLNAVIQCGKDGNGVILDDRTKDGKTIQLFIRRVAVNPTNSAAAVVVAILSVSDGPSGNTALTYNYVARALSEDYAHLYYVNMDTDEFTEYLPDGANRDMSLERKGKDFFGQTERDAQVMIHKDDREEFLKIFTKENIEKNLDENGIFTHTYRNIVKGEPIYVNLKIVRIRNKGNYIIIGVNNVDAQMRHKEALEKMREESIANARISAIAGDIMALYTIDPKTDHYSLSSSREYYSVLKSSPEGENFYENALKEGKVVVYSEDYDYFKNIFNKETILRDIKEKGLFSIKYRLFIDKKIVYIHIKAAMVHERDEDKIILAIINVSEETKRELEYVHKLNLAKEEAYVDELTGVKNKHAYVDMELQLNKEIQKGKEPEFAVAVFDLNDLKFINDTKGHQAGDKYIQDGCSIICETFKHSPVFRLGGDEFAAIIMGEDYENLDSCMEKIARSNRKNQKSGKVVIAAGVSRFYKDKKVADVFGRSDRNMYENKRAIKAADKAKK